MCTESVLLIAEKVVPKCIENGTACEVEAESAMCIETSPLSCEEEPETFRDRTVTIFDWDDTLLSSSFLAAADLHVDDTEELPKNLRLLLEDLETLVVALLRDALALGQVCVITNAESGWVELSGSRFLPGVLHFIEKNGIQVVSARSTYEKNFPESPEDWKIEAFACEVDKRFPDCEELNVLVLGDSVSELQAAHELARNLPQSRVKAVAFQERPSVEQLQRQISVVLSSFKELVDYDGSFDVQLVC
eukprot:Plantae.Rhodophyta-Purpureofilum_apyrenoidigerum.ctg141.p1 GENE.Plantae.Rhodophyta-Purpureofilum_apyrenoidigerum.ctg141~~Plantae.Rhodophyta-Purpureofilum_apyrenoidigerum.ctg141.p1  ORF type:complete len:248 (+),score=50.99 Plantae.Rhodophyta-Purpureofilum_apyrenoidigerum.ctg141:355-1098(+)